MARRMASPPWTNKATSSCNSGGIQRTSGNPRRKVTFGQIDLGGHQAAEGVVDFPPGEHLVVVAETAQSAVGR